MVSSRNGGKENSRPRTGWLIMKLKRWVYKERKNRGEENAIDLLTG